MLARVVDDYLDLAYGELPTCATSWMRGALVSPMYVPAQSNVTHGCVRQSRPSVCGGMDRTAMQLP